MKKIIFSCFVAFTVIAHAEQNTCTEQLYLDNPNRVTAVVNWNKVIGKITADHWGVNDNGPGMYTANTKMADFFDRLRPGIIRRHNSGFLNRWVDNDNKTWNIEVIKTDLANAKDTYKHSRVMLCLDTSPNFIGTLPLTERQEDSVAAFFARLPLIVDSLGYHADMYEFFNEKETPYGAHGGNSGVSSNANNNLPAYWRVLNKIAVAMKAADPAIQVGGPATSYPYGNVYRGFIDNCGANMDFISFHLYARGSIPATGADADLFARTDRNAAVDAGKLVAYAKEKGMGHLEISLNEFNVQWDWRQYEPRHHNHVGAAWMACFIKNVALQGVTGMNIWNTEDRVYGLNYTSAPANLYLMSRDYLRGSIVESSASEDKIEMLPVISPQGEKNILFVNRTGEKVTVIKAKKLLGGKGSAVKGLRLDGTTCINEKEYTVETIDQVPVDLVLNPYGMVLLTK
jgi:xylan 1,4-beta-xylosidase